MKEPRFYVSGVTGYSGSSGGGMEREKTLWYVFDSVPPRLSKEIGWGERGRLDAEREAQHLNEEYA